MMPSIESRFVSREISGSAEKTAACRVVGVPRFPDKGVVGRLFFLTDLIGFETGGASRGAESTASPRA